MAESKAAQEPDDELDQFDDVDLDLDLEDANLREAIGQPIKIRIGGKVLTFPHHLEWTHDQTRMMSLGMWDQWAQSLLSEDDYKVWEAASLKNYQFEAITRQMLRFMGASDPGKSQRSSKSQPRRRRR